jgi:polyvinyl alcohol dehydrogenase (cytochrome)
MVYWGSWDGLEHASRLSDGTDVWTANLGTSTSNCSSLPFGVTSTANISSVPIGGVTTPVDFVGGGGNATFYALNANTGAIIWKTVLSSQPGAYNWSSPAIYNNKVYIGLASLGDCPLVQGKVLQLDASTGVIQHTLNLVPNGCIGASVWSSPTIDRQLGLVYVSTGNEGTCSTPETMANALVAVRATDLSVVSSWQVPKTQQITDGDFGATPTLFNATIGGVSRKMVGLINKNGIYYAFDRTALAAGPVWQVRLAAPESPNENNISSSAWDGKSLYVSGAATTIKGKSCKGSLSAVNPATGAFLWQDCLTQNALDPVIAVPGLVELGVGPSLLIVNSSTGAPLFTFTDTGPNSNFWGPGSISNGVLYQGNRDGKLYAFGP